MGKRGEKSLTTSRVFSLKIVVELSYTSMVLKATTNDRRTTVLCCDEFRRPRSDSASQVALEQHMLKAKINACDTGISKLCNQIGSTVMKNFYLSKNVFLRMDAYLRNGVLIKKERESVGASVYLSEKRIKSGRMEAKVGETCGALTS
ncbi:hypothetical protein TNCV_1767851 [Trichonephila clavipes]|nr:hypothetical protein TNCV_1767851 [Trichonephila clavipes]